MAGYKGEMVFCDKCYFPVMGFAWRLVKGHGYTDAYDLCFTHYNENEDPYSSEKFYCIIPNRDVSKVRYNHKTTFYSTHVVAFWEFRSLNVHAV